MKIEVFNFKIGNTAHKYPKKREERPPVKELQPDARPQVSPVAILAGIFAGMMSGVIAGRVLSQHPRVNHLDIWRRELEQTHGKIDAAIIAAHVQTRYEELYAHRPRFASSALRLHLEQYILPGLALYQVLRLGKRDRQAALNEVERLFEASSNSWRKQALKLMRYLPDSFLVFSRLVTAVTKLLFPPEGWDIEMVEVSDSRYAFNIHSCFYLKLLTAYEAPELTAVFCRNDDLLYEALPSGIAWERKGTIAKGDPMCDFCWRRVLHEGLVKGPNSKVEALIN
jgi:hypothetical protein